MSQGPLLDGAPGKSFSARFLRSLRNHSLAPKEIGDPPMGITAENLAEKYSIPREEQDQFAQQSQQRMRDGDRGRAV